jgi:hypothetical protein
MAPAECCRSLGADPGAMIQSWPGSGSCGTTRPPTGGFAQKGWPLSGTLAGSDVCAGQLGKDDQAVHDPVGDIRPCPDHPAGPLMSPQSRDVGRDRASAWVLTVVQRKVHAGSVGSRP